MTSDNFKSYLVLWIFFAAMFFPSVAASQGDGGMLIINQTVSESSKGLISSIFVFHEKQLVGRDDDALDILGNKLENTSTIPRLSVQEYSNTRTPSELIAELKLFIIGNGTSSVGQLLPFIAALRPIMEANNVRQLLFNFHQKVSIKGDPQFKYLTWTLFINDGQLSSSEPEISNTPSVSIQLSYTPTIKNIGLPAKWSYPNAGALRWRIIDESFVPISLWKKIQLPKEYDRLIAKTEDDKDIAIKCLVQQVGDLCTKDFSLTKLLQSVGAKYAILSYRRELLPTYALLTEVERVNNEEKKAKIFISINAREWSSESCTDNIFVNRGTYDIELQGKLDRYIVWRDNTFHLLRSTAINVYSPIESFEVKKTGLTAETAETIPNKVVNIKHPAAPLQIASSISNLIQIAPITIRNNEIGETRVIADYFHGDCGRAFGIKVRCDRNRDIELVLGVVNSVPRCSPRDSNFYQSQTYKLRRGSPITMQTSSLEHAGNFTWNYDGDRTIVFHHGDWTNTQDRHQRKGMSLFASEIFFPSAGYYIQENFPIGGPVDFYFEGLGCPANTFPGNKIFPRDSFWYESYQDRCLRLDPKGALSGACKTLQEQYDCPRYSDAGEKIWMPTRQDPGH